MFWKFPPPIGKSHLHAETYRTAHLLMHINSGLGANLASVRSLAINNFTSVILFFYRICTMLSINMRDNTVLDIYSILSCFEGSVSILSSLPHIMCQIAGCFPVEYFIFFPSFCHSRTISLFLPLSLVSPAAPLLCSLPEFSDEYISSRLKVSL